MPPGLKPAFFACRGPLHEPSVAGGGGVEGRVVPRLSPTSISRVLLVPTARTGDVTRRPSPGGDHERPTDPTERAPLPLRRHLQRLPARRRRRRAADRRRLRGRPRPPAPRRGRARRVGAAHAPPPRPVLGHSSAQTP